jgi:hypothetical protein
MSYDFETVLRIIKDIVYVIVIPAIKLQNHSFSNFNHTGFQLQYQQIQIEVYPMEEKNFKVNIGIEGLLNEGKWYTDCHVGKKSLTRWIEGGKSSLRCAVTPFLVLDLKVLINDEIKSWRLQEEVKIFDNNIFEALVHYETKNFSKDTSTSRETFYYLKAIYITDKNRTLVVS